MNTDTTAALDQLVEGYYPMIDHSSATHLAASAARSILDPAIRMASAWNSIRDTRIPSMDGLLSIILGDADLGGLERGGSTHSEGPGFSIKGDAERYVLGCLYSAISVCTIEGRLDLKNVKQQASLNLGELARSMRGDKIKVLNVYGLQGILFAANPHVDFDTFSVHLATASDVLTPYAFVVEPKMVVAKWGAEADRQDPGRGGIVVSSGPVDRLCAAILVAVRAAAIHIVPQIKWQAQILPWRAPSLFMSHFSVEPFVSPVNIDAGDVHRIRDLVAELNQSVGGQEFAFRRLRSAASGWGNVGDRFMDAVLVWEALLSVSPETRFRLTATMAKLLVPPDRADERMKLQGDLWKLYGKRSNQVHSVGTKAEISLDNVRSAVDFAIDLVRVLFLERPELLTMPTRDRSDHVLLVDP